MKKLVTAACALVAGMVLADGIESANVVGYIDKAIVPNQYYLIGVQFGEVGGEGTISFDNLIQMTGVVANEDGNEDNAEILTLVGGGYETYNYTNDGWDETDTPLDHDAWTYGGYECTAADLQSLGNGFWFKAPVAASGASINVMGEVASGTTKTVSFGAGEYSLIANPFPCDLCLADVETTGITAYEDGNENNAEILTLVGGGYETYNYTNDGWDETDTPLDKDAWTYGGYECVGTSVEAGACFWLKSPTAGSITFSL